MTPGGIKEAHPPVHYSIYNILCNDALIIVYSTSKEMFLRRCDLKNTPEGESQRDHGGGINCNDTLTYSLHAKK